MSTIEKEQLAASWSWRYATKKFDPHQKISEANWQILAESLRLAPSSYGLQPWKFLLVQNAQLKKKLRQASYEQPQIEDCSHLLVVSHLKNVSETYVKNYFKKVSQIRKIPIEALDEFQNRVLQAFREGALHENVSHWTARQAYIAMGFLLSTAALLRIDVCPMEGIDTEKYDTLLQLKGSDYQTVAVLAMGYRSPEDGMAKATKVRFELADILQIFS